MKGITADMLGILQAPTPAEEVKQRQGPGGRQLDYVDARFVMNRLDEIGAENWQDLYVDRTDSGVRCGIGICVEGEWIWKWDVGTESDIESEKGAYSDAFKRAAVKWGIARDLYGHATTQGRPVASSPVRPAPTPRPVASSPAGGLPEEPEWVAEQIANDAPAPAGRPMSPVVGGECPMHHLPWQLKPGGVSKRTNKPYGPFWACPSTAQPYCNEKPSPKWAAQQEMAS